MTNKRILTALVLIPLTVLAVLYAPDWLLTLIIAGLGALCFDELLGLAAARTGAKPIRWVVIIGAIVTA